VGSFELDLSEIKSLGRAASGNNITAPCGKKSDLRLQGEGWVYGLVAG
jgi:hypothetical protein